MGSDHRARGYTDEEMAARRSLAKLQRMVKGCPTPASIEHRLRKHGGYVGQDDAVATLSLGMAIHANRIWQRVHHDADPRSLPRLSHLIIGGSGQGKSYLVGQLARWGLGGDALPYVRSDMNRLTEFGYWGGDVDQIVAGAVSAAGGDQAVAEAASIVFCDEVDKLRSYGTPNHREVGGTTAQAALLDLVEGQLMTADLYGRGGDGRSLRTTIQFDASCVWVVAAGAFSGLSAIV